MIIIGKNILLTLRQQGIRVIRPVASAATEDKYSRKTREVVVPKSFEVIEVRELVFIQQLKKSMRATE